ncbi:uncharacterized protein BJX67DRAFT_53127 [Aspergillus lucknowensis]|uniref:Uncharacterized protein n=1 Tax=Aspergillus lucknowensis TaxID=176173 RepID=A0ABR4LUR4_9EURO
MALSYPGTLHNYAPHLVTFEFSLPNIATKPHSLLFVGGLTDGLCTVPYVHEIAKALERTEWSIFQLLLSSSYGGWGIGSLDQDIEEIGQCVEYVRKLKQNFTSTVAGAAGAAGKIVIMGHSTGSQDVLHYLHSPNPLPRNPDVDGVRGLVRPVVDGAIMQAPVSDRQAVLSVIQGSSKSREAYERLVEFSRSQPARSICPIELTGLVGLPPDTPVSARRFWSLASPESPERPAEDDLFSTDLTDERLDETFGRVAKSGLLRRTLVVMYSGSDEYAPDGVDKEALMARWRRATNAGGHTWDDEASGVIPGASHNVRNEGQAWLIDHLINYLNRI